MSEIKVGDWVKIKPELIKSVGFTGGQVTEILRSVSGEVAMVQFVDPNRLHRTEHAVDIVRLRDRADFIENRLFYDENMGSAARSDAIEYLISRVRELEAENAIHLVNIHNLMNF